MDVSKLALPFNESELEWRSIRTGTNTNGPWAIVAPYIKSRAIMSRLDEVCGPGGWQVKHEAHPNGIITSIGIRIDDEWVWKADGAGFTDVESFKGGISDGLKRAGVPWGIGRYLYDLPTPMFARFSDNGKYQAKIGDRYLKWDPPPISDSHQSHQKAPDSVRRDTALLRLKDATDRGLYSEQEFDQLVDVLSKCNTQDAVEGFMQRLADGVKRRSEQQTPELAVM